jgi:flagellar hook-length control protein FliK
VKTLFQQIEVEVVPTTEGATVPAVDWGVALQKSNSPQATALQLLSLPLLKRPDAMVQVSLLKQSFDSVKAALGDVKGLQGAFQSGVASQQTSALGFAGLNSGASEGARALLKDSPKALPKGLAVRTLERVESALKEAAKSRDGKTLSFRLDPPQLGQVKVDVSLREGALHARLVPENQQVGMLLKERAAELQSTLRRLGLNVESVTVSVGSESSSTSSGNGQRSSDGKTFQDERNNMPGSNAQVPENTVGNELAVSPQMPQMSNDLDHWIA